MTDKPFLDYRGVQIYRCPDSEDCFNIAPDKPSVDDFSFQAARLEEKLKDLDLGDGLNDLWDLSQKPGGSLDPWRTEILKRAIDTGQIDQLRGVKLIPRADWAEIERERFNQLLHTEVYLNTKNGCPACGPDGSVESLLDEVDFDDVYAMHTVGCKNCGWKGIEFYKLSRIETVPEKAHTNASASPEIIETRLKPMIPRFYLNQDLWTKMMDDLDFVELIRHEQAQGTELWIVLEGPVENQVDRIRQARMDIGNWLIANTDVVAFDPKTLDVMVAARSESVSGPEPDQYFSEGTDEENWYEG